MRTVFLFSLIILLLIGCKLQKAEHNYYTGKNLYKSNDYEKALNRMTAAIIKDKDYVAAYYDRGEIYYKTEKFEKAKEDFEKVLGLNPKPSAKNTDTYLDGTSLQTYHAKSHRYLALIYETNPKDTDNIISNFEKAIMVMPDYREAYKELEEYADKNLITNTDTKKNQKKAADVYFFLARYHDLGLFDSQGSKRLYQKVIEIKPDYAQAYYSLAKLLDDKLNETEQAKINYLKAIEYKPDYAEAHMSLSLLLYQKLRDIEGAKEHYKIASHLNPDLINTFMDRFFGIEREKK